MEDCEATRNWRTALDPGSHSLRDFERQIESLPPDQLRLLEETLQVMAQDANLRMKVVGGYSKLGIHLCVPGQSKPFVVGAIIPRSKNILIRSRQRIDGFSPNKDTQLRYEKALERPNDMTRIRNIAK